MTEWTIDLPVPPSENNLFRNVTHGGRTFRVQATPYKTWRKNAMQEIMLQKNRSRDTERPIKTIAGPFEVEIVVDRKQVSASSDIQNRMKAAIDILQVMELVENDKHAVKTSAAWGHAPMGCRVTVRAAE